MIEIQNQIATATGNLRGTLDATGVQLNGAGPLAEGYWEIGADCEFYLVMAKDAAVALASVGSGSRSHPGGDYIRFRSDGNLYASMKAVGASGTYRANRYESL